MQNFILWIISHTTLFFPMQPCHTSMHPAACDSLRRPSIEEQIGAPPAGAELKVRAMRKAAVHFSGRCEVIGSAFVVDVGAQCCQAHVEPHSHSSNTFFFSRKKKIRKKTLTLIPVYCLWTTTVQHTWQFLLSSSSNKWILCFPTPPRPLFLFFGNSVPV